MVLYEDFFFNIMCRHAGDAREEGIATAIAEHISAALFLAAGQKHANPDDFPKCPPFQMMMILYTVMVSLERDVFL